VFEVPAFRLTGQKLVGGFVVPYSVENFGVGAPVVFATKVTLILLGVTGAPLRAGTPGAGLGAVATVLKRTTAELKIPELLEATD
jgi:hypothetical protein